MTDTRHVSRSFRKLKAVLQEATAESKLAYAFNTDSHSFGCMNGCLAAERALENLGEAFGDIAGDEQDEQHP